MIKFLLLQKKVVHIRIYFNLIIRFSPEISICLTDVIILLDIKYVLKLLYIICALIIYIPVCLLFYFKFF